MRHQFDELVDTFCEMVQVPMTHNRLEKYLEYVFPDPKDRPPLRARPSASPRIAVGASTSSTKARALTVAVEMLPHFRN